MEEEIDLRQYLQVLRRWVWLILGFTVVAALAAFIVSSQLPPVYSASVTLLVRLAPSSGINEYTAVLTSERLATTYSKMITGRPVMEEVIQQMGLPETAGQLAKRVKVEVLRDTQLVRVSVEDTDPARAADIANTIATVFVKQTQAIQQSRYADSLTSLQAQMDELARLIQETQIELERLGEPRTEQDKARKAQLESILAGYRNTYVGLVQSYEQLRLTASQSTDTLIVFEEARVPTEPVRPRKLMNTALAGVLGAMVSVGAAFVIEYLDDTLKTPDDVNRTLGLPTLSAIGRLEEGQNELIMTADPLSPVSEAFRVLRTNIRYSSVDRPLQVLLVTSSGPEEGKSVVAANLATALAQAGLRTVLLDADMRRPRIHHIFGLHPREGLTGALLAGSTDGRLQPTEVEGLSILPVGEKPPNPVELLGSQRMRELREELRKSFDAIVVDSPPALIGADAAVLAQMVDGVLLVVNAGETRRDMARQAVESLRQVGANVIGVVLNRVPTRRGGYYYYYPHYYYYQGYYGEEEKAKGKRHRKRRRA
jgi:succinoglycan biosynthesis transport protein ExoP